jgi:putative addiction module killer protein
MVRRARWGSRGQSNDRAYAYSTGKFFSGQGVGSGVFEYKIDFGPGLRIYFGKDGDSLVILIGGGTKKRQQQDIATAKECWAAYKRRKKQEIQ